MWSVDPHRLITLDGQPFSHDFRCLSQHGQGRVKMLIAITAYNESWGDILGTIKGVVDNLCTLKRWRSEEERGERPFGSSTALRSACSTMQPHEVAVLVVVDGREKMSQTMFGAAEDGCVLSPEHRERMAAAAQPFKEHPRPATCDVRECHVLELDFEAERSRGEVYSCKLNLIFAVKEKNGGKLNSHVWFFRSFCPLLRPRYCVLLDAGTVPAPTALLLLYADMESNRCIGGSCGEICVDRQQQSPFNLVVSAQLFEYCTANLLDKAMVRGAAGMGWRGGGGQFGALQGESAPGSEEWMPHTTAGQA